MKNTLIALLLALAAMSIAMVSFAGPVYRPQPAGPVQITVAVDGFTCQMCPDQLQQDLAKLPGVTDVQATLDPAQVTAKLDEAKITVSQFVNAITKHKTAMDDNKTYGAHLLLFVDMQACANQKAMCERCKVEIPARLKRVKGIDIVTLDASGKIASLTFAPDVSVTTHDIVKAIEKSSLRFAFSFSDSAKATKDARHQLNKGPEICH
ncbi:MAG TPA: cation transporter [Armatimonadota bacterium]